MKKVLIFEPHGDDAYISAFSVLKDPSIKKRLVTFSCRSSSYLESLFDNLSTEYLDLPDINVYRKSKINTHQVHRQFLDGEDVYTKVTESIIQDVSSDYEIIRKGLVKTISEILSKENPEIIYSPLGLDHPYHIAVASAVREALSLISLDNNTVVIYYAEKPYVAKRYVQEMKLCYHRYIDHLTEEEISYTEEDKVLKSKHFLRAYPTENVMLVWTKDSVLYDPDIFLRR